MSENREPAAEMEKLCLGSFADALWVIQRTAVAAAGVGIMSIPGDPGKVLICSGGRYTPYELPPPVRRHSIDSLETMIDFATWWKDLDGEPCTIWHALGNIVLRMGASPYEHQANYTLVQSRGMLRLATLDQEKNQGFEQRDFIRLLRIELGQDNATLVTQFRRLDWDTTDKRSGEVSKDRESLGAAITKKVQGVDELPDELAVEISVYDNLPEGERVFVLCAVEIDFANQRFSLVPLPGELQAAIRITHALIHRELCDRLAARDLEVPVFYGRPQAGA